jgi:hypothetical protein
VFQFTDSSLSGLLPQGIWFSLAAMTISFSELTFEVSRGLLFRAIKNHIRRHAIPVKNQ